MNPTRYDVLARLIDDREAACGLTKVIAVDGPSGAGKSDFAGGLAAAIGSPVLRFDDVYPGWSGLAATPLLVAKGVLSQLAIGEDGAVAGWDWHANRSAAPVRLRPTPVLVLDGVGSGAHPCRPFLSMLIWLEAPADTRKARALARDGQAYAPFWDMWAEQERILFATDDIRKHADMVVDTSEGGILGPDTGQYDR